MNGPALLIQTLQADALDVEKQLAAIDAGWPGALPRADLADPIRAVTRLTRQRDKLRARIEELRLAYAPGAAA